MAKFFQVGTIRTLLNCVFEGDADLASLKKKGDFGIGTFNDADGELVILDGKFYQITNKGTTKTAPLTKKTPFAVITRFQPKKSIPINSIDSFKTLEKILAKNLESENQIYAIKIEGCFKNLVLRCILKQKKPYTPLYSNNCKIQTNYFIKDSFGTLIGTYFPKYMEALNVQGFHFHFLSQDKKIGGHVFDLQIEDGKADLCPIDEFSFKIINSEDFKNADLKKDMKKAIKIVEKLT